VTRNELIQVLRNGENSGVAFQRDSVEDHQLARELVAFANLEGGCVFLGVEDDGAVSGLARPDPEEWVMTACRDKIRPELTPYFEVVREVAPGRDVAVVRVSRGWNVHHLWHANHRTYYVRVGSQSREASQEELARLFQQRGAFRLEVRPVSGSSMTDLDLRRLGDYFTRLREQEAPGVSDEPAWRALLLNIEMLAEEGPALPATVAALLLFGKDPNRFLPQAGMDAVAYPGTEKDYAARERAELRGPLLPLVGGGGLVESGLVEQALAFVRRNTEVTAWLENGRRLERWTYPEEVVREAVVNALVHRDYLLSGTAIEMSIYDDRLEVCSPGRLPNGVTPERMRTGCRVARNPLLKDVMRDYRYLEHMGMGVPRKIIKGMRVHNGTEPDLVEDGESFLVRLWKAGGAPAA